MLLFLSKQKGRWPGSFRDGNNGRTSVVLAQGLQPGIGLWGGVSRLGRNSHISPLHWPIPPVKILKRSPAAARCHIACFNGVRARACAGREWPVLRITAGAATTNTVLPRARLSHRCSLR